MLDFGTPLNPFGCWDWWGYTNFNYAVKAGRQVTMIRAMLDRLTSAYVASPVASPANQAASSEVVVNDISDTGVAIAWKPVATALAYTVYRATGGESNFAALGSASAPSFGDMSLRPAASFAYRVTANFDGSEGPASPVVTATTLPVPPRCDRPGSCAVR